MTNSQDIWSEWLQVRRFGNNEIHQTYILQQYKKLAKQIVDKALIFESATVLDIGAGDGVVGLTALERLGPRGKLILSDVSRAALNIPMKLFSKKKIQDTRVDFMVASVDNLSTLSDCTIDRTIHRAVLLYVKDKLSALREIYRVLSKNGIAVFMEPINERNFEFGRNYFRGYNIDQEPLSKVKPIIEKVIKKANTEKNIKQHTLFGYNEHTIIHLALKAGFKDVEMDYNLKYTSNAVNNNWDFFFESASNPYAMTLHELMSSVLSKEEFTKLERILKLLITQPAIKTSSNALFILKK